MTLLADVNHLFLRMKWPSRRSLYLTLALISLGCGSFVEDSSEFKDLYENGTLWSYGQVQLGALDAPGTIMLELLTPARGIDDPKARFRMFPATYAQGRNRAGSSIAYVDLSPAGAELHAYAFDLLFEARAGATATIDAYAMLRRDDGGYSYEKRRKVFLGSALFDNEKTVSEVSLSPDLKLSKIRSGALPGRWALHFPDAATENIQEICTGVHALPGTLSNQIPSTSGNVCQPLPAKEDICSGNPLADGCLPPAPAQNRDISPGQSARVPDAEFVADHVYRLIGDTDNTQIIFTSKTLKSTESDNSQLCSSLFFPLGRTAGNKVNKSCSLKLGASTVPTEGFLTCKIQLQFVAAQTYNLKACNITGTFVLKHGLLEAETVQILKP